MNNKKIIGLILSVSIITSVISPSIQVLADQFNVISIGKDLSKEQKNEMLKYFNAPGNSYEELTITNKDEREQLGGIIPDSQIGTRTISCAYVEPTTKGGINVKTTNLTYITGNMIANALTTAGICNANVVAAAPFSVSGTGALTGVILGYQKATGEEINEDKKELANKELQTTIDIAKNPEVGQDKATAVISEIKSQVIQNGNNNTNINIGNIIINVSKDYGVKLTDSQSKDVENIMRGISKQDYNKSEMKSALSKIKDNIDKALQDSGELKGFFNNLKTYFNRFLNWITGLFKNEEKEAGITNQTNNKTEVAENGVSTGSSEAVKDTVTTAKDLETELENKDIEKPKEELEKPKVEGTENEVLDNNKPEADKENVNNSGSEETITNEIVNTILKEEGFKNFNKEKVLKKIAEKKLIINLSKDKEYTYTILDKENKDGLLIIKLSDILEGYEGTKILEIKEK